MHTPVLQKEVIEYLKPQTDENFIDATLGFAGHSKLILEKIKPRGRVLGIEKDKEVYEQVREQKIERLIAVNDSYTNLDRIIKERRFGPVDGILFDLGMSLWHIEKSGRGFSFLKNEPLDMRFNSQDELKAEKIVNSWPLLALEKILKEYGGERFSRQIAKAIIGARKNKPIKTTFELVEIIKKAVPQKCQHSRIHPATKTFQALRIAVNNELENIKIALPFALQALKQAGRLAVISFHSGEDRLIKNFFRQMAQAGLLKVITKKPISPGAQEIKSNPRSRSAKLRAAVKC